MKKHTKETIIIGAALIGLSVILHFIEYVIFRDLHHILLFLFTDLAFIPLDIFFTALIIEKMIEKRDINHKMEKLIIIKGVFYTELGDEILRRFVNTDPNINLIEKEARVNKNWGNKEFKSLENFIDNYNFDIDLNKDDIDALANILNEKKDFLISLITNPTLMEHESFSDTIISLIHLREELQDRYYKMECEFGCCDKGHIKSDMIVAYRALTKGWIRYIKHLKEEYPQLFIKEVLNNPFDNRSFEEKYSICANNREK